MLSFKHTIHKRAVRIVREGQGEAMEYSKSEALAIVKEVLAERGLRMKGDRVTVSGERAVIRVMCGDVEKVADVSLENRTLEIVQG